MALLRLVTPTQRDNLVLTTSSGLEIAVQTVIRAENEYVVVRGRQTRTADGGGVFFVPYDQIHFMGFQKPVKEMDIRALYGEVVSPEASQETPPETEPAPPAEAVPPPSAEPAAAPPAPVPGAAGTTPRPGSPNKAVLLERLRSRRQEAGNLASSP
jgi:hypothetical protein